ncbi:anti-sigma factor [Demequina lignilytica]|uniref:Regulator of SigK n=1 Tax=Demequina lignilytica TaxID=3051663 RepID=A0AAW7M917_9MICO|nr:MULTISPECIES: anti-sigma factor [unclassified Demequina]MDN4477363.1 anti-sigma factor [Demequina sp. SYSU T00039-1]MDN4483146.1 anti-sigma factor [Demequina sp. SYSU T0a273]MDN4487536.1 anti-sigma factor [Demequina sp. SYSU T00039]
MDVHDLAAGYAIGALDPEELRDFEAHLDACARCRAELRSLATAVEALAETRDDAVPGPSADLASRIAREVRDTPQAPRPASSLAAARRRRPVARVLALAAAVLVVAGVGVVSLLQGLGTDGSTITDYERIRAAGDREDLTLGLGEATVWISHAVGGEEADGVAIDGSLPALGDDLTYQVWVVPADGGAPVPGPVLRPTPDGTYASSWITPLGGAAAVAVSVEPWDPDRPEEGSTTPTEVVAAVEL